MTFDQECCLLYKAALDKLLPPEAAEIVILRDRIRRALQALRALAGRGREAP